MMQLILLALYAASVAIAAEDGPSRTDPKPVPETRPDLKRALEASKDAEPRLPLPPLSDQERERAGEGGFSVVNNGRMRRHYLPPGFADGGFPGREEPGMTLGYPFQTTLFWIVSRANNCTYCLGHQESKLSAVGIVEDRIAALDGDWAGFTPAESAAFAFARKLTTTPHEVGDADVDALRPFYDDPRIAEIVYVVSSFNAMNRWTGALNIPQEHHRDYLAPTPPAFEAVVSLVAPLDPDRGSGGASIAPPARRPALETRAEVEAMLAACRERTARIPLVDAEATTALLPDSRGGDPTHWVRLLAHFPNVGITRVGILKAAETEGSLDPLLRARVAWVAARHDRAWYALGHALDRLRAAGQSDDEVFALDEDRSRLPEADRLALRFARTVTVDPALVTDADFDGLREHFTDHQVAELLAVIAEAAFFNRLTEGAGLPLE